MPAQAASASLLGVAGVAIAACAWLALGAPALLHASRAPAAAAVVQEHGRQASAQREPTATHAATPAPQHERPAGQHAPAAAKPAGETSADEHAAESIWPTIARLVNFAILAGALVYFARSPFAQYLVRRSQEIRSDLKNAAESREAALAQTAEIERRLKALPAELAALRARGAGEVVAEEARIREATEAERGRLVEHARREIDHHSRIAERDLRRHAADLAIAVARARIAATIGSHDHGRLVDQYLQQLGRSQGG